jgi:hypothetical protein
MDRLLYRDILAENMLPHAKEKNASGLDFPAQQ